MTSSTVWRPITPPKTDPVKEKTTKRITITNNVGGSVADLNQPVANAGMVIPYLIGRHRVMKPNIIWYGDVRPIRQTSTSVSTKTETDADGNKIITETTTNKVSIVGYNVAVQLGLCLGPSVTLLGVYEGKTKLWEGSASGTGASVTVKSDSLDSEIVFYGGDFNQPVDPYLASLVEDVPGYVGTSYVIVKSIQTNKLGSSLGFELRRVPNPLGLSAAVNLSGDDVNLASAMADIITSRWGGSGVAISKIDVPSFQAAAAEFAAEGNYCSLLVGRETSGSSLLKILQEQGDATIFPNPSTGKLQIKLIRRKFYKADGVNLWWGNIVKDGLRSFDKGSREQAVEEHRTTFTSRAKNYEDDTVYTQVLPALDALNRGKKSGEADFPAAMTLELATALNKREYAKKSRPLFGVSIEATRQAASALPGDIVPLNLPDYKIFSEPIVISKVRKQPITGNTVTIDAVQLATTDIVVPVIPPRVYPPTAPDPVPQPPVNPNVNATPYWILKKKGVFEDAKRKITAQFPMFTPQSADPTQVNFVVRVHNVGTSYTMIIPEQGDKIVNSGMSPISGLNTWLQGGLWPSGSDYPTFGKLEAPISYTDGFTTGIIPSVILTGVKLFSVDGAIDSNQAGVKKGSYFVFLNNEVLGFEKFTSLGGGRYQLTNVHRALLDTVPVSHAANDVAYLVANDFNYATGSFSMEPGAAARSFAVISQVIRPISSFFTLQSPPGTFVNWGPTYNRSGSPLRPHDTKIEGARSASAVPLPIGAQVNVTWKTRNRDTVGVSLQSDAAEKGEINAGLYQRHRVFIIASNGTHYDCGATATDNTYNSLLVNVPNIAFGAGWLYVRSEITIEGTTYVSQFQDRLPIEIIQSGARLTEARDVRVTEAGDYRIEET